MARGYTGAIIHFVNKDNYSEYQIVQGRNLNVYNDFIYKDGAISYIEIDIDGNETAVEIAGNVSTNLALAGEGLSTGALVGIICGSVGGALLLGGGAVVLVLYLKKRKATKVAE